MVFIRFIRGLMIHACIICSLALVAVHVLDWYNPFMDFAGHTVFLQYILIDCSLALGLIYVFGFEKGGRRK